MVKDSLSNLNSAKGKSYLKGRARYRMVSGGGMVGAVRVRWGGFGCGGAGKGGVVVWWDYSVVVYVERVEGNLVSVWWGRVGRDGVR